MYGVAAVWVMDPVHTHLLSQYSGFALTVQTCVQPPIKVSIHVLLRTNTVILSESSYAY